MTDNETISENASDQIMPPPFYQSELRTGIVLGVISSIAYSAANLALREVAIPGDLDWAIWVTALKAVPAATVAWLLIGIRVWKKLPALPPRALVVKLILAALLMQYGGNLCFQWSLTLGGLAVSVPLCFAVLIVTGAWLGRIFLGDVLSVRTRWAIGILGVSIFFLTAGAQAATASIHGQANVPDHSCSCGGGWFFRFCLWCLRCHYPKSDPEPLTVRIAGDIQYGWSCDAGFAHAVNSGSSANPRRDQNILAASAGLWCVECHRFFCRRRCPEACAGDLRQPA